jgi:hypothetical protein
MATRKRKKNGRAVAGGPKGAAPLPPPSFEASSGGPGKSRFRASLGALAQSLASELRSAETFASDFGERQSPEELAELLSAAGQWRAELIRARAWLDYAKDGDRAAWSAAVKGVDRFLKAFEYAVACDPSVASRYPQAAEVLREKSAIALRGAATRARKKAARPIVTTTAVPNP